MRGNDPMNARDRLSVWLGSAAFAALATVSVAEAGGFAVREQSAYGQGSAFAGVAAGGSLSTMFWNPATLSQVQGFEFEAVGTGVFPDSDVSIDALPPFFPESDAGDIGQDAFVPAGYAAYRLSDRFVVGIGVNSPFGFTTNYPDDTTVHELGVAGTSEVFSVNVNPAVSYQMNDWLALALGAQIQYIDVSLTAQTIPGIGLSKLEADDVGYGFTAGVLVTPLPGTELGLGYRSFIDHKLSGDVTTGGTSSDATADDFDLPDTLTLGIRQRITDSFRLLGGIEWSNWSRFEEVALDTSGVEIPLGFNYNDGWLFSVGGEYDLTQKLTVRAGIAYELSPLDDDNRSFRLPDNDRLWLSAGASYKASDRFAFDVGYSYLTAGDTQIVSTTDGGPISNGPFSGEADSHVHIISAALKIKLGGQPAIAEPVYK
jgi:long-chain fatty acid transport protein